MILIALWGAILPIENLTGARSTKQDFGHLKPFLPHQRHLKSTTRSLLKTRIPHIK